MIAGLYAAPGYPQPATRDAVVAYLAACPEKPASEALGKLRKADPGGVAAAEFKLGKQSPSKQ